MFKINNKTIGVTRHDGRWDHTDLNGSVATSNQSLLNFQHLKIILELQEFWEVGEDWTVTF